MSKLGEIFKREGVSNETLIEIVRTLQEDQMQAMTMVAELNLPNEANTEIMQAVMSDPNAIDELAKEIGISEEEIDSIKDKLNPGPGA